MPWFRFLRKSKTDQAATAAATVVEPPAEEPEEPAEEETSELADGAPRKRRRRGSRGGRSRRRSTTVEGDEPESPGGDGEPVRDGRRARAERAEKGEKGDRAEKAERSQRRSRSAQGRRRQPARRPPLPEAKRELLISVDVGEQRVAVVEDEKVAEVYLERPERRSIAGNIYLGVVDNVLPGMEAAFVEIGLEKNGFLYVDEIVVPELEGKRHGKKITDLIQRGQVILVQAVKDPMKTKGARLTTEISLPGRFLVYVPQGEGLGVSRRLDESERNRLKDILKGLEITEGGVIVRTAAEGASAEDIERDLVFLQRLWKTIQVREKAAKAPELVYQEAELPLRIVRDLFAGGFEAAHVDNDRAYKRIVGYLKKTSPDMLERVHRYKEKEPLFERHGVEREIASTLDRRVDLPSGGYLIFDYAEAFTVIDVNTGRFVGSRSKNSTQRLEDTIVKNNLEAVKEVVRQLRLRDIGGIIVIDFIDMANPKNRQAVEEALRQELERDRTKTYVVEISPLGLVEMTRQNVTDGPREVMTRKCPTCGGDGIVVSDTTSAMKVERELRAIAAAGARGVQAYRVAVHPRILPLLAGDGGERLRALDEATKRRIFLVDAEGHVHPDHVQVLAEGKTAEIQPATPIAEGAEIEVKLLEVGLHDATAAVGTVDGVQVVVADAASLVGRKTKVAVGLVLEGRVFATLVGRPAAAAPITFESEAEKPTRAPARRKPLEAPGDTEPLVEEETEADEAGEGDGEAEVEVEIEVEAGDGDEAATRRRARRGSRGGRRRRKAPGEGGEAGEAEAGGDEAVPAEAEAGEAATAADAETPAATPKRRRTPRIHVPGDGRETGDDPGAPEEPQPAELAAAGSGEAAEGEDGDAEAAPRKRTRRGSRGGRNRRRKAAGAVPGTDGEEAAEDEASALTTLEAGAAEDEPAGEKALEAEPTAAEEVAAELLASGGADPVAEADAEALGAEGALVASIEPPAGDAPEAVAEGETTEATPEAGEPELVPVDEPDADATEEEAPTSDDYVPMSEWIEDFDRR